MRPNKRVLHELIELPLTELVKSVTIRLASGICKEEGFIQQRRQMSSLFLGGKIA